MSEEIEESIKILNSIEEEDFAWYIDKNKTEERIKAIKTISNYIENSISKKVVEDKINQIEEQFDKDIERVDSYNLRYTEDFLVRVKYSSVRHVLKEVLEGE